MLRTIKMALDSSEHDWRDRAACRDQDPELFFPQNREFSAAYRAAKQVCDVCPVISQCLEFAIDHCCEGVWGGTSTNYRQQYFGQLRWRAGPQHHDGHRISQNTSRCLSCDANN